eukprot:scaffold855_cov274-Chaetoceros_neogracile.AAC.5
MGGVVVPMELHSRNGMDGRGSWVVESMLPALLVDDVDVDVVDAVLLLAPGCPAATAAAASTNVLFMASVSTLEPSVLTLPGALAADCNDA